MLVVFFLFLLLISLTRSSQITTYIQDNGYILNIEDNSNGSLGMNTIQNQANLFFRLYPGISSGYADAPSTITIVLDPTLANDTIALASDEVSLSVSNLLTNNNDSNYMEFGLKSMLNSFYTQISTTTSQPTTKTWRTVSMHNNTYSQNGYTLMVLNKSNGTLSPSVVQNQVNLFFKLYPLMAIDYVNAPTNVTLVLDTSVNQNSIVVTNNTVSLSAASLLASGNDTLYLFSGLNHMLNNYYSTKAPVSNTTIPIVNATTPSSSTRNSNGTTTMKVIAMNTTRSNFNATTLKVVTMNVSSTTLRFTSTTLKVVTMAPNSTVSTRPTSTSTRLTNSTLRPTSSNSSLTSTSTRLTSFTLRPTSSNSRPTSSTSRPTSSSTRLSSSTLRFTTSTPRLSSSTPRLTSTSTRLTSSTPRLTSSTLRLTSSTPRLTSSTPRYTNSSTRPTNSTSTFSTTTLNPTSTTTFSPFTTSQQLMLNTHNNYRSVLASGLSVKCAAGVMPPATNMNKLNYSTDLESKAANWAKQCVVSHTPNITYGQNLCTSSGQETNFTSFFLGCAKLWWNEVLVFPSNTNLTLPSQNFTQFGHFTQMAWHDTKTVGCAMNYCPGKGTLLFCNYDHGNVIGRLIYRSGNICSQCTSNCNMGLCVV